MSFKGLLGHPGFANFEDLPELGARDGADKAPCAKAAADQAFAVETPSRPTSDEPTEGADQPAPAEASRANKKPVPFSLRLSFDERARLEAEAGDRPLGAYIRERLFGDEATKRIPRRKPTVDRAALGKALATLGQSNLASNLNQLARAANIGTLPVDDEVVQDLNAACAAVSDMRDGLMRALQGRPPVAKAPFDEVAGQK